MATRTSKQTPKQDTPADPIAQLRLTVTEFPTELPVATRGRKALPNPFADAITRAYADGMQRAILFDTTDEEALAVTLKTLRRAASQQKRGLKVKVLREVVAVQKEDGKLIEAEPGIYFTVGDPRPRASSKDAAKK